MAAVRATLQGIRRLASPWAPGRNAVTMQAWARSFASGTPALRGQDHGHADRGGKAHHHSEGQHSAPAATRSHPPKASATAAATSEPSATAAKQRIGSLGFPLPDNVAAKLTAYPSTVTIPIQWGYQDLYGHVNNVNYMRFFESARMQYFVDLSSRLEPQAYRDFIDARAVGPILASASIVYKAPVTFPDTLTIGSRVGEVKDDRFSMTYVGVSHKTGRVVCEGDCWIVTYDYRIFKKAPIPAHILDAMNAFSAEHARTYGGASA